ncbi:MAG: hypothetical protein SO232_00135 [Candidatus Onthovivens sp.]|nr:hypothetical protein [Mollicutes bacterium]MDY4857045.1 hypothetical protein [Candidatus Onthovivens sp.]
MEENNINNLNNNEAFEAKEIERKELEKKKSTFRLFWLFIFIDLGLLVWIIYLLVNIFIDAFKGI